MRLMIRPYLCTKLMWAGKGRTAASRDVSSDGAQDAPGFRRCWWLVAGGLWLAAGGWCWSWTWLYGAGVLMVRRPGGTGHGAASGWPNLDVPAYPPLSTQMTVSSRRVLACRHAAGRGLKMHFDAA
eukprot:scaffold9776_cov126-Isochrysis_galbana.AAC.13